MKNLIKAIGITVLGTIILSSPAVILYVLGATKELAVILGLGVMGITVGLGTIVYNIKDLLDRGGK